MIVNEKFSMRLKELRKTKGETTKTLGEAIGCAANTVTQWETQTRQPNFDTLCKLAAYFGVSTDYLLGLSDFRQLAPNPQIGSDPRCFYTDVELHFYECDKQKRARIETILRLMADIAGVAYGAKGYTHTWLWEHHSVFLVTRASIRIRRMPRASETITVETWEVGVKGAQYVRDFGFYDRAGNKIIEGRTYWVVVDPQTHVIQRPADFPGTFTPIPDKEADTLPAARLKPGGEMASAGTHTIVFSDIDGNNHTYNARYAGISCDVLPPALLERELVDFRIDFKQEALFGETLALASRIGPDTASVSGMLGDTPSFVAEFYFK